MNPLAISWFRTRLSLALAAGIALAPAAFAGTTFSGAVLSSESFGDATLEPVIVKATSNGFGHPTEGAWMTDGTYRLADNSDSGIGTLYVDPPTNTVPRSVTARFRFRIDNGSDTPGNGLSFRIGPKYLSGSTPLAFGEFGQRTATAMSGLAVRFNRRTSPSVEAFHSTAEGTAIPAPFTTANPSLGGDATWNTVIVHVHQQASSYTLKVLVNGVTVVNDVAIPGYAPTSAWAFGWGARSSDGDHDANDYIDDLSIDVGADSRIQGVVRHPDGSTPSATALSSIRLGRFGVTESITPDSTGAWTLGPAVSAGPTAMVVSQFPAGYVQNAPAVPVYGGQEGLVVQVLPATNSGPAAVSGTLSQSVGATNAVLSSGLYPGGSAAGIRFDWGTSTAFGNATATATPVNQLSLDGTGDYLQAPTNTWFSGGDFTLEGWVRPRSYGNWSRLIDFGNGGASDTIFLAYSDGTTGRPAVQIHGSSMSSLTSPFAIPLNQWSHLAFVYSGTTGTLYINGQPVASATGMARPNNVSRTRNYIGRSNWFGSTADTDANADIGEVRIWSAAVTASELNTWMARPADAAHPQYASLQLDYTFRTGADLGSGNVRDDGPNGRTGMRQGDASLVQGSGNHFSLVPENTVALTGLLPGTTYFYRAVATNAAGSTFSTTNSFTTSTPTLDALAALTINEDAGLQTVALTGIGDGDPTTARPVVVTATSSNPSLVPAPSVAYAYSDSNPNGTLTFAPVPNATGTATLTVTVAYASGTGVASSVSRTLAVTVNAVNDAPVAGWGQALEFAGATDPSATSGSVGTLTSGYTVEMWARPSSLQNSELFRLVASGVTHRASLTSAGAVNFTTAAGSLTWTPSPTNALVGVWTHMAFVVAPAEGRLRLYRDGQKVAEGTIPTATAAFAPQLVLGSQFLGRIAEFRVWSTVRSAGDVALDRNAISAGTETGLETYYRFNEASGAAAFDSAASSGNAILSLASGTFLSTASAGLAVAPVLNVLVSEDTARVLHLPGFDFETSPLTWRVTSLPANATLTNSGNLVTTAGTFTSPLFTFAPAANFKGTNTFTYSVTDGGGLSSSFTVTVNVQDVNDPPVVQPIANQLVEEGSVAGPITVLISELDTADDVALFVNGQEITASSSDSSLVRDSAIVLGGSGGIRTLSITPESGEIGTTTITVRVFDGEATTAVQFDLRVMPKPAYAIYSLGRLSSDFPNSFPTAVNDDGAIAGYAVSPQGGVRRGFFTPGILAGALDSEGTFALTPVDPVSGDLSSEVLGLNAPNVLAGVSTSSAGSRTGFRHDGTLMVDVGDLGGGDATLTAINDTSVFTGYSDTVSSTNNRALRGSGSTLADLGTLASPFNAGSQGLAINSDGVVAGVSLAADGTRRATRWTGTTAVALIGTADDTNSIARGINRSGQVVGASTTTFATDPALDLDVTRSAHVDLPDATEFAGDFTLEGWVYPRAHRNWARLYETSNGNGVSNTDNVFLALSNGTDGKPIFRTYRTTSGTTTFSSVSAPSAMTLSNWTHVAVTYTVNTTGDTNRGTGRLYVNGSQVAVNTDMVRPNALLRTNVAIGRSAWTSDSYPDARFNNVRSWSVARTATEIALGMAAEPASTAAGLVFSFPFDEGSGTNVTSTTGLAGRGVNVGWSTQADRRVAGVQRAFLHDPTAATPLAQSLGTLPGGNASQAYAVNDFGQVAGSAFDAAGTEQATLHSAGRLYSLADVVSPDDAVGWSLLRARAINRDGLIVGDGRNSDGLRGFAAVPATVIGKPVARPQGSVAGFPQVQVISPAGLESTDAFHWSAATRKLYAIRPCIAKISWPTTFLSGDTNLLVTVSANIWPRTPTVHVAGSPAEVEPAYNGVFPYSFREILHTARTDGVAATHSATVDPGSRIFTATTPGYAVLHYLKSDGNSPDPLVHAPYFEVVRTYTSAAAPERQSGVPWTVGTTVTHAAHSDYAGKTGHVLQPLAPIDAEGPDRAYDVTSRSGAIIPVNLVVPGTPIQNLTVVWYRKNSIGVAWPQVPITYSLAWPTDAPAIVIASQTGSGPLPDTAFPQHRIYNQPDPAKVGYNPNEEHAAMFPTDSGEAAFALRSDLNAFSAVSEPFVLVKYRNPSDTTRWAHKVFQVVAEQAPHFFQYSGVAGTEVAPPLPLSLLPRATKSTFTSGPGWEDHKGTLYARAAGPEGSSTNLVVRWYYPLQEGWWFDLDGDGVNDRTVGTEIPWLDRHGSGHTALTDGTPVAVDYVLSWPDAPVLEVGSSLLGARNGLPAVGSMARVQIIHDDAAPDLTSPTNGLARLYDPISTRSITLAAGESVPGSILREADGGKELFTDLPGFLRNRLRYDPLQRTLEFSGLHDDTVSGQPLVLPNVLSDRELARLKALAPNNASWTGLVTRLYHRTRNPNQVDFSPRDGVADTALRLGLTTVVRGGTNAVVQESFPDSVKALSAALNAIPAPPYRPGMALSFTNSSSAVDIPVGIPLGGTFTLESWFYPTNSDSTARGIIGSQATSDANFRSPYLMQVNSTGLAFGFGTGTAIHGTQVPAVLTLNAWNHVAAVFTGTEWRVLVNGRRVGTFAQTNRPYATPVASLGRLGASMIGRLDEVRLWTVARTDREVARDRTKRLVGNEPGLAALYRLDESTGTTVVDSGPLGRHGTATAVSRATSDAPTGIAPRYLTLAENNDASLPGLPVALHVIEVDDGPYTGDLKVLESDNVFDERVTLRHSGDFGGDPSSLDFEWYYKPDSAGFNAALLPTVAADGTISAANGWIRLSTPLPPSGGTNTAAGAHFATLGEGGESGLLLLGDVWFVGRYRGYAVNGQTNWSDWFGDPSSPSSPRAMLVEGWIKRVLAGLNPFDNRTSNFRDSATSTLSSMVQQAGPRFEGAIAFNPDADAINGIGLIQAYQTVLNRGRTLSIDGTPAVNLDPANNALLLAASRIADLYTLLGNEAYADAQDPTIGFGTATSDSTSGAVYGALASSIFCFQNQLDSLLEEELVLLRGRDDSSAGVQAAPVYNRLYWNFTQGEGEVAYQQNYAVGDQDGDGFIDEKDARVLYPQGHGDAWGHYLTAMTTYYDLLRSPNFTWVPRTESVTVAGVPVAVDYTDERKFARTAALKARTGREVAELTYRSHYTDDPEGQWQGYMDDDTDRAWGVTEWTRRTQQGAYFDWVAANALLPDTDPDPAHTGIRKIDRTTVREIAEIAAEGREIQTVLDRADSGLNPLGLAQGVVPFDIDPSRVDEGETHFEQIQARATKALNNALTVWNEANLASQLLRRNQDTVERFSRNADDQEQDYKNRLIEVFGYPYAGDIGAGKTFPSGYDGPDLYHYMYVEESAITGQDLPAGPLATGYYGRFDTGPDSRGFFFDGDSPNGDFLTVQYPLGGGSYGFDAPVAWGSRRAPGEIQNALSEIVQTQAALKRALAEYGNLLQEVEDLEDVLAEMKDFHADQVQYTSAYFATRATLETTRVVAQRIARTAQTSAKITEEMKGAVVEGLPKVSGLAVDCTSTARALIRASSVTMLGTLLGTANAAETAADVAQAGINSAEAAFRIANEVAGQDLETKQHLAEIRRVLRDEAPKRLEIQQLQEKLRQQQGNYLAVLAKGQRLLEERVQWRRQLSADLSAARYRDMTFRIFRNDALQKYRAAFDLAQRYVLLAATAYDYESNLLGTDSRAGREFLTDIVRQRSLGRIGSGTPVAGSPGLADPLARLTENFSVLKSQLGFNNPQTETGRFSLRNELYRLRSSSGDSWKQTLAKARVENLWDVPEFRRFCRPFASESAGAQPGLVLRFPTTVNSGLNFFGRDLAGGDSAYDSSRFATRIRSVGVWFSGYDGNGLSVTPRVYLVPVGMDVLRSPDPDEEKTRAWRVVDQALPVPFTIGPSALRNRTWIPSVDTLGGSFADIRRFAALRAYHDAGTFTESEAVSDSRLIGRSVWNTEWMLVIPGSTLLADPDQGLDAFLESVSDIKLFFQTYSYSGQ
jgi:hypothetical protein